MAKLLNSDTQTRQGTAQSSPKNKNLDLDHPLIKSSLVEDHAFRPGSGSRKGLDVTLFTIGVACKF
jgi:hypothetical protein